MKRTVLVLLLGVAIGGFATWLVSHGKISFADHDDDKPAAAAGESEAISVSHDAQDRVVIHMSDEAQGEAGIVVTNPVATEMASEFRCYGRALDPAALCEAYGDFTAAQAANDSSQAELKRLTSLAAQDNASARALQTAAATAAHDQAQLEAARLKWLAAGCPALAARTDLATLMHSLGALEGALIRADLPAGETLPASPTSARCVAITGEAFNASVLGEAASVDAQTQNRGMLLLIRPAAPALAPGAAVTAYLQFPERPAAGVIVPRDAVVRAEGTGWVYVLESDGTSFTRREIPLDHPVEAGWFVAGGIGAGNFVVVTGAQTLLSQESKAALRTD